MGSGVRERGIDAAPRSVRIDHLVERLRDARDRARLGLAITEDLEELLDDAACELEEAGVDVQLSESRGTA